MSLSQTVSGMLRDPVMVYLRMKGPSRMADIWEYIRSTRAAGYSYWSRADVSVTLQQLKRNGYVDRKNEFGPKDFVWYIVR